MDYWQKQLAPLYRDLEWNFPEQKSGTVSIIGGSRGSFASVIKLSESLGKYPIAQVKTFLPDSLAKDLPPLPGLTFLESTESGSFAKSPGLNRALEQTDFTLLAGDLSKNSATSIAVLEALQQTDKPILLARDAVDCICLGIAETIDDHDLFLFASMAQLQKLFRTLFYPKMLMLSHPLLSIIETLHKFTLSYERITLITLHEGQIIVAHQGKITTTPLAKTGFNVLSFFTGSLPADILAYNLWNPGKPLEASSAALFH
ncbi:hypothetical protein IJ103_01215 [Candidatus Saccharibacteria bacterium]|nr:hypothetical protein [Candidatus Saccharibacteria bacterium]